MNQYIGVSEETCGLRALVREAYTALGLQTYFTSGETETKAWTIYAGWTAPRAAGVIHSDFERFVVAGAAGAVLNLMMTNVVVDGAVAIVSRVVFVVAAVMLMLMLMLMS